MGIEPARSDFRKIACRCPGAILAVDIQEFFHRWFVSA